MVRSIKTVFAGLLTAGLIVAFAGENCDYKKSGKEASLINKHEIKTGKSDNKFHGDCPAISKDDLVQLIKANSVVLIDANKVETYKAGHIPGAINYKHAGDKFAKLLPKDKKTLIVAYCGGPGCSAWNKAALKLNRLGYDNIKHYPGGLKEWKASGQELNKI